MSEQVLRQVTLFASLPESEIRHLAATLRPVELAAGAILFREHDPGDHLYLVLDGELEVVKALGTPDEHVLALRRPGEFAGEMSLLNPDGRRTATIRARTAASLFAMTRADFDALLHREPSLAYDLARVLSTHLQESNIATIRDLSDRNRALAEAYRELQAAQAQLVEKEALERELQVARDIQLSMLPRRMPAFGGFDLGARMLPARAVGGDFFDLVALDDRTLGIVIGDASGKGVPAALFMALACTLLRAEATRHASPRAVLDNVNRQLLQRNDAGMFVTLFYGMLDREAHTLRYVRAGHELPIVLDACGAETSLAWGVGQPLGILDEVVLDEEVLMLASGSTLVLYTDGATDAVDAGRTFFGLERLRRAIQAHCALPAQSLCEALLQTILTHQGAAPQADDITLVALRAE